MTSMKDQSSVARVTSLPPLLLQEKTIIYIYYVLNKILCMLTVTVVSYL